MIQKKFVKTTTMILLTCFLATCSNNETKHLVKKLDNGILIDLYLRGEDIGFNDVSYTRDITLIKRNEKLKLDLGKTQWPGGYVLFHTFKTSDGDSSQLMVFFNYHYDDNIFKVVDPEKLILVEDTTILNQVKKVGKLSDNRIYWGDFAYF